MKYSMLFIVSTMLFGLEVSAQSGVLGQAQLSAGCGIKPSQVVLGSSEIRIPMKLAVNLNAHASEEVVARKNCAVSIPVELDQDQGLQIEGVSLEQTQYLTVGTSSKLQVEVFKAGTENAPLKIVNKATSKSLISKSKIQHKTSVVFGCGQSGILRINSVALLEANNGYSASSAKMTNLRLKTKLVRCR